MARRRAQTARKCTTIHFLYILLITLNGGRLERLTEAQPEPTNSGLRAELRKIISIPEYPSCLLHVSLALTRSTTKIEEPGAKILTVKGSESQDFDRVG